MIKIVFQHRQHNESTPPTTEKNEVPINSMVNGCTLFSEQTQSDDISHTSGVSITNVLTSFLDEQVHSQKADISREKHNFFWHNWLFMYSANYQWVFCKFIFFLDSSYNLYIFLFILNYFKIFWTLLFFKKINIFAQKSPWTHVNNFHKLIHFSCE